MSSSLSTPSRLCVLVLHRAITCHGWASKVTGHGGRFSEDVSGHQESGKAKQGTAKRLRRRDDLVLGRVTPTRKRPRRASFACAQASSLCWLALMCQIHLPQHPDNNLSPNQSRRLDTRCTSHLCLLMPLPTHLLQCHLIRSLVPIDMASCETHV